MMGATEKGSSHAAAYSAWWAALPIAAYIGINALYGYFNSTLVHCQGLVFGAAACTAKLNFNLAAIPDTIAPNSPRAPLRQAALLTSEASARMYWMSAVVLVVVVAVFVIVLSLMWTWDCLANARKSLEGRRGTLIGVGITVAVAGLVAVYLLAISEARGFVLVERVFTAKGVVPPETGKIGVAAAGIVRVITFASGTFLVLATASLLLDAKPGGGEAKTELAQRGRYLQWILYAGASTLIVGLLEFRALFGWASASAAANGKGTASLITSLADAAAASAGAVYAITLGVLYLPVLLILRTRAARLFDEEEPADETRESWLQKMNLGFDTSKTVTTLVTVLSPLLAQAPISAMLNLL